MFLCVSTAADCNRSSEGKGWECKKEHRDNVYANIVDILVLDKLRHTDTLILSQATITFHMGYYSSLLPGLIFTLTLFQPILPQKQKLPFQNNLIMSLSSLNSFSTLWGKKVFGPPVIIKEGSMK